MYYNEEFDLIIGSNMLGRKYILFALIVKIK